MKDDKPERILMSIHPEFAAKIISGKKRFEFRKVTPKRIVKTIVLYETKPIGLVTAEAEVSGMCYGTPDMVWEHVKNYAGITEEEFRNYYAGCDNVVAYRLGDIHLFDIPLTLEDYNLKYPPQSFTYLD